MHQVVSDLDTTQRRAVDHGGLGQVEMDHVLVGDRRRRVAHQGAHRDIFGGQSADQVAADKAAGAGYRDQRRFTTRAALRLHPALEINAADDLSLTLS